MKTRIISGIVMGVIVAIFLSLGMLVNSFFIVVFLSLIAGVAVYEMLHNVAKVKTRVVLMGACVYSFFACLLSTDNIKYYIITSIAYALFAVIMSLKFHQKFDLSKIVIILSMPMILSFAFYCLEAVINNSRGLYYLLLLFNFSSICDMGAYFVGVTMGKHKLCPEISPKKTIEGAIGGIICSVIFAVIIVFAFGMGDRILPTIILTIPLCIVGMLGDLFASVIKRAVDLKDYGTLIPGHGGILDRLDSMLLLAPVLVALKSLGVI